MAPQCRKGERNRRANGSRHVTLIRPTHAHPIAEAACLCATATNIGKREPTEQRVVRFAKNEERIGHVATLVLIIPFDTAAKRRPCEIVGWPNRFPGLQKFAAQLP